MTKQKQNSVQKSQIPGAKPYFVQTSENEADCPHFDNRRLAREAGKRASPPAEASPAPAQPTEAPALQ